MANFLLPPPQYADPAGSFMSGFAAPYQLQNEITKNYLINLKADQEQAKQEGLKQYADTGNINKLMAVAPEVGVHLKTAEIAQQKATAESIKPAMEYFYLNKEGLKNPTTYKGVRDTGIAMAPILANALPPEWHEGIPTYVDQQAAQFEKKFKLENGLKPIDILKAQNYRERTDVMREKLNQPKEYQPRTYEIFRDNYLKQNPNASEEDVMAAFRVKGPVGITKPIDPTRIHRDVTNEVRQQMKWKDMEDEYTQRASDELLKSNTYPVTSWGITGRTTTQVPFGELPLDEQRKVRQGNMASIKKRARELFDTEFQTRVATGVKARTEAGKTGGAAPRSLQSMSIADLKALAEQMRGKQSAPVETDEEE